MGRQRRRKRVRRIDQVFAARYRAARNERRGRRISPTSDAYASTLRTAGVEGIVQALISRHNQRWEKVGGNLSTLGEGVAETMHVVYPIDVVLWQNGVRFTEPPPSPFGGWPEHLRWGVDSACQAQRMILAGNLVGAASLARTQLERWSLNRIHSNGLDQPEGVAIADHYTAIWANEDPAIEAGQVWLELSELLHGRGPMLPAARWEASEICGAPLPPDVRSAILAIETAVQLALRQILLCAIGLALDSGYPPGLGDALRMLPLSLPSEVKFVESASLAIWPMNLKFFDHGGHIVGETGANYLNDVRERAGHGQPRELSYSARGLEAFISRRARWADLAAAAFAKEREQLGDRFDPDALAGRELAYILTSEAAGLLAKWRNDARADALAVAAGALRASFWLWLEDDERSMMLARTILEQTARLRTWRLRPDRAAALEDRGARTSSRDWLREAGWRRLSALNRSLGEFSHATMRARWTGAREALAAMQGPVENEEFRPQTGRGAALNHVAFAFGAEVRALALEQQSALAKGFEAVLPYGEGSDEELETWLERCWAYRDVSLGDPDLQPTSG